MDKLTKRMFGFLFKKRNERWNLAVRKLRKKIVYLNNEIKKYKVSIIRMRSNDYVYFTQIKLLKITACLGDRISYQKAYRFGHSRCGCSNSGYGYEWRENGKWGSSPRYLCEKCIYKMFSKILRKDVLEVLLSINMDTDILRYYKDISQQNAAFLESYSNGRAVSFSEEIIPEFIKHYQD